jgi:hypothetical protein
LWRAHAASPIYLDIDVLPEFDVVRRVTFAHDRLWQLTVQPRVNRRREHACVLFLMTQRHFSIGERTLRTRASRRTMMVAVEPAKAVFGAEIVYH